MKTCCFTIVFLVSVMLPAQNNSFGKVSKEELQEKFYPTDSSANAAYLYKYRKTYFNYIQGEGFQLITEIHERLKIYNKDGFEYATKSIPLYKSGSSDEKVNGLKGYTYNFVDGKIEETKLKKDGIFKTEVSKYWDETKFTLPQVKEGSVLEYKYEIQSPFISNVDEFEFQHAIPIKRVEARFEAPEYFNFKIRSKGFLAVVPVKESVRDEIRFVEKTRRGGTGFSNPSTTTSYDTSKVDFVKEISTYNLENIPALKEEPYVNSINNYRSSIKYELSFTQFPNSAIEYYSTTWEDVVNRIYKSPDFGDELNRSRYFESDIDALISSVSDPIQRVALIFEYVKNQVRWNGYYSIYANNGLRKAYAEHEGNVAEINLMLTSMLRYAGLDANPVLVSTRRNGIPLFPTREGYNYVICGIELPNNVLLLDATSQYSAPNILPFRALNWQGRIIRKSGSSALIDLYPKQLSKNTVSMFIELDEEGVITGKIRAVKTGHEARSYRQSYNNVDEEQFLEKMENQYKGMEIEDFAVKNSKKLSKPVMESCSFTMESQADIIDDKIYFSPLFFMKMNENPFKLEKREFPVDFGYPKNDLYRFTITLPEGYKIESIPEPKIIKLPENIALFSYNIKVIGRKIQLAVDSKINVPIVSSLYYDALKSYFSSIIEAENQQIVLTRI